MKRSPLTEPGWGLRSQGGDRGQQLAPVTDRGHADADQVVGRQLRQYLGIDIIVVKCRRVSSSPSPRSHATTSMRKSSSPS
jgi:hypothetical protein